MKHMTVEELMDILDWFDDCRYEYFEHIMLTKLDAEERIARAMPELCRHAEWLVNLHRGTDAAYPEDAHRIPA